MKKIIPTLFLIFTFFTTHSASALTSEALTIAVPTNLPTKICSGSKFSGVNVVWGGVTDERDTHALVSVYKNDVEIQNFVTDQPLTSYFDQHIQSVLSQCGINFVKPNQPHSYVLNVLIEKFGAESDKKLVKSSAEAESRLKLVFEADYTNVDVKVAFMMDSKMPSFKNKKKLSAMMSDLFVGTLTEMIQNGQLDFIKSVH